MAARVFVAYTGGTIGMLPGEGGYAPVPGAFGRMFAEMPELKDPEMPNCVVHEFDPLLDSANMRPSDWNEIGGVIRDNYDDHDGFVVVHGTDTMAYTASALSFMLEGLKKPVVLTGSQIPLCKVRNDARHNLFDALMVAAGYNIPEVLVVFAGRIYRGNRTVKVSADGLHAFASPNYPELGRVSVRISIIDSLVRRAPHGVFKLQTMGEVNVGSLRLFPGIKADLLANILKPPLQGLVLECYGVGNAPVRDAALVAAIREATQRGILVAISSQCAKGMVDLRGYETGSALARAGAIGGLDMTPEAMMTKMTYLLSKGHSGDELQAKMQKDLRGELSPLPVD